MAFTEDVHTKECCICNEPRYDKEGKDRKTFDYIPLIHRLRLQYANPYRAKQLTSYVESLGELGNVRRDIWDGSLMHDLRTKKALFGQPTDLALGFSTDGANLFKQRGKFSIWPFILVLFNLPPDERTKESNIILSGIVPGPGQAEINMDTYLRPLVEELKILQQGVPDVWNGDTRKMFTLKAHLCTISGDTPARDKISGVTGEIDSLPHKALTKLIVYKAQIRICIVYIVMHGEFIMEQLDAHSHFQRTYHWLHLKNLQLSDGKSLILSTYQFAKIDICGELRSLVLRTWTGSMYSTTTSIIFECRSDIIV